MITIIRTNSGNKDFEKLVDSLNSDLAERDGADHPLAQFNTISTIKHAVLALKNGRPIGCGAMAKHGLGTMEIKRMYVSPRARGKRIGTQILTELECWARELGSSRCLLFTGRNQPEANRLYERQGYRRVDRYGKLVGIKDSLCFCKEL